MYTDRLRISAYIFLPISILFVCAISNALSFCDNPDWIPTCDRWEHPNESSGTSTLSCANTGSSCITVRGPCDIRFKWGIYRGYDELRLLDNGTFTGRHLPTTWDNRSHVPHDSEEVCVNYSIRDNLTHEIKWEHENPHDIGTAWVAGLCIYMVDFKNVKPIPEQGISDNEFNYSVDIESRLSALDVELFVIPPNANTSREISLGKRTYHQGEERLEWGPVILNCTGDGMGKYWFRVGPPVNKLSKVYEGPNIKVFKRPANGIKNCSNESICNYSYCVDIESLVNGSVELRVSDNGVSWSSLDRKNFFEAKEPKRICWYANYGWRKIRYPVVFD